MRHAVAVPAVHPLDLGGDDPQAEDDPGGSDGIPAGKSSARKPLARLAMFAERLAPKLAPITLMAQGTSMARYPRRIQASQEMIWMRAHSHR